MGNFPILDAIFGPISNHTTLFCPIFISAFPMERIMTFLSNSLSPHMMNNIKKYFRKFQSFGFATKTYLIEQLRALL